MTYVNLVPPQSVILGLESTESDHALSTLASALCANHPELSGREDEVRDALREREAQGSTGQHGVAIPHIKLPNLSSVCMVIGVNDAGLDFSALDGEPVHVMFGVVRPEEGADEHLDVLRWIAGVAGHQDFVSFACQAKSQQEFIDLLTELTVA